MLRELFLLRDDIARRRDLPPFKILSDRVLVQLAQLGPRRGGPARRQGASFDRVRRYGDEIIEAVARGRRNPPPEPPARRPQPDPEVQLRQMPCANGARSARCNAASSPTIVSREALWALAKHPPSSLEDLDGVPGLGPWRRAQYGRELLSVLAGG